MKTHIFLTFCLVLFGGFLEVYSLFRHQFSGVEELSLKVKILERGIREEKMQSALVEFQFEDYKQEVAEVLPEALRSKLSPKQKYQVRTLASVALPDVAKPLTIERASSVFEKAKQKFRDKEFAEARDVLQKLLETYPDSLHVIEAHFLLAEALYRLEEFETCVTTINEMITLYPEHETTGYALLLLGGIYEKENRLEDAAQVYRAVVGYYPVQSLQQQAKLDLKRVEM